MKKKLLFGSIIICVIVASYIFVGLVYSAITGEKVEMFQVQKKQPLIFEFPFELVYKLNDETFVVNDVYACEYKGTKWNWNQGYYQVWNGYIKGTGEDAVHVLNSEGYSLEIHVGNASYYMKTSPDVLYAPWTPIIAKVSLTENSYHRLNAEEALSQYNLEILSFEHATPRSY